MVARSLRLRPRDLRADRSAHACARARGRRQRPGECPCAAAAPAAARERPRKRAAVFSRAARSASPASARRRCAPRLDQRRRQAAGAQRLQRPGRRFVSEPRPQQPARKPREGTGDLGVVRQRLPQGFLWPRSQESPERVPRRCGAVDTCRVGGKQTVVDPDTALDARLRDQPPQRGGVETRPGDRCSETASAGGQHGGNDGQDRKCAGFVFAGSYGHRDQARPFGDQLVPLGGRSRLLEMPGPNALQRCQPYQSRQRCAALQPLCRQRLAAHVELAGR